MNWIPAPPPPPARVARGLDPVQNPAHYTQGKIEVWDFIADQDLGFLAGNVIKYVCRYRHKGNPKQDLLKARAYLDKLIGSLE